VTGAVLDDVGAIAERSPMKSIGLLLLSLPFVAAIACGGNEPAPQTPTTAASASAADPASAAPTTSAAAPATASATAAPTTSAAAPTTPELSTEDKARTAIYEALKRDDKEGFKKLVSKRILARQNADFDKWYGVWKAAAQKGPDAFKKVTVTKEDGAFKLDEN
jgi:hypothetical protein